MQEFEYVVRTAAAHMPNSCWGTYRRVAVLKVVKGATPKMISNRARGVLEIVDVQERLNVGTTERCAYSKAVKRAQEICNELNGGVK